MEYCLRLKRKPNSYKESGEKGSQAYRGNFGHRFDGFLGWHGNLKQGLVHQKLHDCIGLPHLISGRKNGLARNHEENTDFPRRQDLLGLLREDAKDYGTSQNNVKFTKNGHQGDPGNGDKTSLQINKIVG